MNIYDIAKLAGVSIATVSRVVNNSPNVSERTKQRVLAVMEEHHYTPNVFARGLGLDSMKTIGIVCPDVRDAYVAGLVASLEGRLREYGYDCILYCSGYKKEKKEQAVELILQKRIDALVLAGSTYAGGGLQKKETDYIRQAAAQVPVFVMNGRIDGENIYCVYSSDYQATYETASAMIESGRSKILFLTDSHSYSANKKLEGYEAALRDHGLPVLGSRKLYTKNQVHYVRDILLARKDLDFDSVLATDDGLAVGAVKYAHARRLQIPKDLCIVGYNNSELAVCCEPELSSIDNFAQELCGMVIDEMMGLLREETTPPAYKEVACHLVKRCSTDF